MRFASTEALTRSGQIIDLADPQPDDICIRDIAFSLSRIVRFCGHVPGWNVAQHSIWVAERCDPEWALEGLMHDASEAYVGDVWRPLKTLLGKTYSNIEDRFHEVIAAKFGLSSKFDRQIKRIDNEACAVEIHQFWPQFYPDRKKVIHLRAMPPWKAERQFLKAFERLSASRRKLVA